MIRKHSNEDSLVYKALMPLVKTAQGQQTTPPQPLPNAQQLVQQEEMEEMEEPKTPPPPEVGVPFVKNERSSDLKQTRLSLELPFDYLTWGMLVDKKYADGSDDEFDAIVYYDERYEPSQAGDFFSEEIAGGYDPSIHHIVVQGRDVIEVLSPKFVEELERKLADELNSGGDGDFDPGDFSSSAGLVEDREWAGSGPLTGDPPDVGGRYY